MLDDGGGADRRERDRTDIAVAGPCSEDIDWV